MKHTIIFAAFLLVAGQIFAQQFITRNGHISFYSEAPLENIEAHNYQASSIIDVETGDIVFTLLIKGFEFEKALMQEHFNEKYLESDQFPKATFEGVITNLDEVDLMQEGTHQVQVKGELTIHGVTQEVTAPAIIEHKDGQLIAKAKFPVAVADYDITIPSVVSNNIAEVVDVTVDVTYDPYQAKK